MLVQIIMSQQLMNILFYLLLLLLQKVYQFLKEPLIKKYGEAWYAQLIEVDKLLTKGQ